MRHLLHSLGLLLLLLLAQQGALVHELSHGAESHALAARVDPPGGGAELPCALCPAFAQVLTPTVSHGFVAPPLSRATPDRGIEPRYTASDASVPRPRSRGPPSSS